MQLQRGGRISGRKDRDENVEMDDGNQDDWADQDRRNKIKS